MENVRNHVLKSNLNKFSVLIGDSIPELQKAVTSLNKNIKAINLEIDFDQFVKKNRTGLKEIRQHFEYESYQPVRNNKPFTIFFVINLFLFS